MSYHKLSISDRTCFCIEIRRLNRGAAARAGRARVRSCSRQTLAGTAGRNAAVRQEHPTVRLYSRPDYLMDVSVQRLRGFIYFLYFRANGMVIVRVALAARDNDAIGRYSYPI